MSQKVSNQLLAQLAGTLEGDFHYDTVMRTLYATDASAYREMPTAVAIPKSVEDIKKLIAFAANNGSSIIPRTAGTSLAGQVWAMVLSLMFPKILQKFLKLIKKNIGYACNQV
jgi:FAD/FMN-containing dehydrogenase